MILPPASYFFFAALGPFPQTRACTHAHDTPHTHIRTEKKRRKTVSPLHVVSPKANLFAGERRGFSLLSLEE